MKVAKQSKRQSELEWKRIALQDCREMDAKRKRLQGEGPGEDHESKPSVGVRRPRLSFAGEEDDF